MTARDLKMTSSSGAKRRESRATLSSYQGRILLPKLLSKPHKVASNDTPI